MRSKKLMAFCQAGIAASATLQAAWAAWLGAGSICKALCHWSTFLSVSVVQPAWSEHQTTGVFKSLASRITFDSHTLAWYNFIKIIFAAPGASSNSQRAIYPLE
jgi:hypothetical protein